jgi:hypothetical protein
MQIRDRVVEGELVSITEVNLDVAKDRRIKEVKTEIVIKSRKGEEEIKFRGIVFPDSIGHRVRYKSSASQTPPEDDGTYVLYSVSETLEDLDINRTYRARRNMFSED